MSLLVRGDPQSLYKKISWISKILKENLDEVRVRGIKYI